MPCPLRAQVKLVYRWKSSSAHATGKLLTRIAVEPDGRSADGHLRCGVSKPRGRATEVFDGMKSSGVLRFSA